MEGLFSEVAGSKRPIGRSAKHSTTAWWHPLGLQTRRLGAFRCTVVYLEGWRLVTVQLPEKFLVL